MSFLNIVSHPSERIFQVDQDCYIVYLGSNFTETSPFLRIGGSKKLSSDLTRQVRYLLLTDQLLQNFCYENENIKPYTGQKLTIIGTENQLDLYKILLQKVNVIGVNIDERVIEIPRNKKATEIFLELETDEPESLDRSNEQKYLLSQKVAQPVKLVFQANKNVEIYVGRQRVTDLKEISTREYCSNSVLDSVLDQYIFRNKVNFYERGFVLLPENLMFYDRDHLFLSGLPKNYFKTLLMANINPDHIELLYEDVFTQEMERFLQRSNRNKKINTKIYSSKHPLLDFFAQHYEAKGHSTHVLLDEDVLKINETNVLISPDTYKIKFKSKDSLKKLPEIDYFYTSNEANKISARKYDGYVDQFNDNAPKGHNREPDEYKASINIIPSSFNISKVDDYLEDKVFLVYVSGKSANINNFKERQGVYRCYPYIDYRFSKTFTEERNLSYAVELYLNRIISYRDLIIRHEYKMITQVTESVIYGYVEKSFEFKDLLSKLYRLSMKLPLPKNRYEFILLHNMTEFAQFIFDLFASKNIIGIESIENVASTLLKIKNKSTDLEIGSHAIKGNINLFINEKRYLFYSIWEDDTSVNIPRQYEVPLQPGVEDSLESLQIHHNKTNQLIKTFRKDIVDPNIFIPLERDFFSRESIYHRLHDFLTRERARLQGLYDIVRTFNRLSMKKQVQTFAYMKSQFSGKSMYANDMDEFYASLVGGVEEVISGGLIHQPKRNPRELEKEVQKAQKISLLSGFGIIFLAFILFNASIWLNAKWSQSLVKSSKDKAKINFLYIVDDIQTLLLQDYQVYFERQKSIEFSKNDSKLEIRRWSINIYESDVMQLAGDLANINNMKSVVSKNQAEKAILGTKVKLDTGEIIELTKPISLWAFSIDYLVSSQRYHLKHLAEYNELLTIYDHSFDEAYASKLKLVGDNDIVVIKDKISKIISRSYTKHARAISKEIMNFADQVKNKMKQRV